MTSPPGRNENGYNLVMLMVIVTLLNIALAASLPLWSHVIQRDKEEELISRGFQYAEAIRVFQNRFQRPPIRLQELIEVKPRSIRRLWKDPMSDDGQWRIIPVGTGGPLNPQNPGNPDQQNPNDPNGRSGEEGQQGEGDEQQQSPFGGKKGEEVMVGPFHGVQSRSGKKSILIFNGRERYDEWQFTVELLMGQQQPQGNPNGLGGQVNPPPQGQQMAGGLPNYSIRWIGRPLPAFLQQPQMPNNPGLGNPTGIDPNQLGPRRKPPQQGGQSPEDQ